MNAIQERVETIRAKTMACGHCNDDGFVYVYFEGYKDGYGPEDGGHKDESLKEPREICKVCCDERALLDIIDELMETLESNAAQGEEISHGG